MGQIPRTAITVLDCWVHLHLWNVRMCGKRCFGRGIMGKLQTELSLTKTATTRLYQMGAHVTRECHDSPREVLPKCNDVSPMQILEKKGAGRGHHVHSPDIHCTGQWVLLEIPDLHCIGVFPLMIKNKASRPKSVCNAVDGPFLSHTVLSAFSPWKKVNDYPCTSNMHENRECVIDILPDRSPQKRSPELRALPDLNDIPRSPKHAHMVVPMKTPFKASSTCKPSVFQGVKGLVEKLCKSGECGGRWNDHKTQPPIDLIGGSLSSHVPGDGMRSTIRILSYI